MQQTNALSALLHEKLDARLSRILTDINLTRLSRIEPARIQRNALPTIGLIELVSGPTFTELYHDLYITMFHAGERERPELIVERLDDDFAGMRTGLVPYRIIGIRDPIGHAAAAAQFSILSVPADNSRGLITIPYLQYIYVRPESRRRDLSELLHTLVLGLAAAESTGVADVPYGLRVPFTLFETEPPGHGDAVAQQAIATERTEIHARSGSMALMLRSRTDGRVQSAHVQPGLDPGDPPLTLTWVLRATPGSRVSSLDIAQLGSAMLAAYYQSLRDEKFPESNIVLAETILRRRLPGCDFILLPLADVVRNMYVGI